MTNKFTFKLIREDLQDWIYCKSCDENNNPVGRELKISYDDWDKLHKERIGKNLYEIILTDEQEKSYTEQARRIEWIMQPQIFVPLMRIYGASKPQNLSYFSQLSSIVDEYTNKFGGNAFELKRDLEIARQIMFLGLESSTVIEVTE